MDDADQLINRLDDALRQMQTPFHEVALVYDKHGRQAYARWYARVLSSLALLVGEDEMLVGFATYRDGAGRIVVLTNRLVAAVDIDSANDDEANFVVSAVPRSSIRSVTVESALGPDGDSPSRGRAWPGTVTVKATYDALDDPIVFQGADRDMYDRQKKGTVLVWLDLLRDDLAASAGGR